MEIMLNKNVLSLKKNNQSTWIEYAYMMLQNVVELLGQLL